MDTNPIKYKDLFLPDNSIKDLIVQLDEANSAYMNFAKNVRQQAVEIKATMTKSSGATRSSRQELTVMAEAAEKLRKAQRNVLVATEENTRAAAKYKNELQQQNAVNKLVAKRGEEEIDMNNLKAYTYDQVSAQYSLNKITLNSMTDEYRENSEEGKTLVKNTLALYEQMKKLQEETGKHQLSVGDYTVATKGLIGVIRQQTYALAQMRAAGMENTAEYKKLQAETAKLKGELANVNREVSAMASNTSTLGSVMSGLSAAGGAFSAATGALTMFGGASEDVAVAQKQLQSVIAITTGLTAIQSNFHKQSAVMLGISRVQTYALAKAEVYRRLIQIQGNKATATAVVTQKLWNAVATANPYFLLAGAIITLVGALFLFTGNAQKAIKAQEKLNAATIREREIADERVKALERDSDVRQQSLQRQIQVAQAQGKSIQQVQKLENDLYLERRKMADNIIQMRRKEIDGIDDNKAAAADYLKQIEDINTKLKMSGYNNQSKFDITIDGNALEAKAQKAIELLQTAMDEANIRVEIGYDAINAARAVNTEAAILREEWRKQMEQLAKMELDIMRKSEDEKIKLIYDSGERQRIEVANTYNRQIEDLKTQLAQDRTLTAAARKAINEQIISLEGQLGDALLDVEYKIAEERRNFKRSLEDAEIAAMSDSIEKERKVLLSGYDRDIEDLKIRLETERTLTEEQRGIINDTILAIEKQSKNELLKLNEEHNISILNMDRDILMNRLDLLREDSDEVIKVKTELLEKERQLELAQNRTVAEELKRDEMEINRYYDELIFKERSRLENDRELMLFDRHQQLLQSEFDLLYNTEEEKTRFRLQAEADRWKKILALNATAAEQMSEQEVKTIQNTIAGLEREIGRSKGGKIDIWGAFGIKLDDKQRGLINESFEFAKQQLIGFLEEKIRVADAAVEASNKEVDAARKRLDAEIEARNKGYAHSVDQAAKALELEKKNQEKALKEQQKAQKAQALIQSLQQIGNMITATSAIWANLGGWPPLAIAATALMWGSFAFSKIKAAQMVKSESYGEGTVELLHGGSHASGNDVDLGTKPDGTKRRAEGGEYFAVFNKKASRRHRALIPDIVKSLNDGSFTKKYMNAYATDGFALNVSGSDVNIDKIEKDVNEIKEQNKRKFIPLGNGKVMEVYKNLRRIRK